MSEILAIIGALGGFEAIKWLITSYRNRNTEKRREIASVVQIENETREKQIDRYEQRLAVRDAKIDKQYLESREKDKHILELTQEISRKDLEIMLLTFQKCEVRKCPNRQPPSEY